MADLIVELYGTRIGTLAGSWRTFDFVPDREAVAAFGLDSQMLSVAIPLALVPTRAGKNQRQNFFRELLPEGRMLDHLARTAQVPGHDTIGLLRRYGRDVAGALQIWDPEAPGEPRQPALEPLDTAGIAVLLQNVTRYPLGNKPAGGKTSLAGVQDKIVLTRADHGWSRALDGYPSTHILKPASRDYPTSIYDEEYGARFARALGLAEFASWIEEFGPAPALVVERYDRSTSAPTGRLHQEDFNQALGASGNEKYQRYGGRVSLARIAALLGSAIGSEAQEQLLQMTVLAVAVGNLDMHAKNISLLHPPDGTLTLAPAYDVVPQAHQPTDGELALAVDGVYRHAEVTADHLLAEAHTWGALNAEAIVTDALHTVLKVAESEGPDPRAHDGLAEDIALFTTNLLAGRPAGARAM